MFSSLLTSWFVDVIYLDIANDQLSLNVRSGL